MYVGSSLSAISNPLSFCVHRYTTAPENKAANDIALKDHTFAVHTVYHHVHQSLSFGFSFCFTYAC